MGGDPVPGIHELLRKLAERCLSLTEEIRALGVEYDLKIPVRLSIVVDSGLACPEEEGPGRSGRAAREDKESKA